MHPFTTPSGGAIDQGKENESVTSNVIQNYLRSLSKNKFRGDIPSLYHDLNLGK